MVPLTRLIRKDQPFSWGVEAKNAFQSLKVFFTIAPLLIHADPTKPFVLEMNISDFALSIILPQHRENKFFHLINFHILNFSCADINYEIHDKELFAIMDASEELHHLLKITRHETIVYLNHKNLQYFMIARVLNQCQARRALCLF